MLLSPEKLTKTAEQIANSESFLSENSRLFLQNVYQDGVDKYAKRLEALGFGGLEHVLDAGCGFGQWSIALSQMANKVEGCDLEEERILAAKALTHHLGIKNVFFRIASMEKLPYEDQLFDGVISYSSLYLTNFDQAISELARILKSCGLLYLSTNDIGYFLRELIIGPHRHKDFDSRIYALKTFGNMILGNCKNLSLTTGAYAMRFKRIIKLLRQKGFHILEAGSEGCIANYNAPFVRSHFVGIRATYDILAIRS